LGIDVLIEPTFSQFFNFKRDYTMAKCIKRPYRVGTLWSKLRIVYLKYHFLIFAERVCSYG